MRWWVAFISIVAGAGLSLIWPRGPITLTAVLVWMIVAIVVGIASGYRSRSRWEWAALSLGFLVGIELGRIGVESAVVGGLHLGGLFGNGAFAVGRIWPALIVLLPALVAFAWARVGWRPRGGWAWTGLGIPTALLIALVTMLLVPATTAPIDGTNSVAELTRVDVNDHSLRLLVRGQDQDAPVLLFLAGGPGGSELGSMGKWGAELEKSFVVVTVDQRGTGASYGELEPTDTMTTDGAVADIHAVTEFLMKRFDEQKIFLAGNSGGTILGILAIQQRPELYRAFVGTGQMVCPRETDQLWYDDLRTWAAEHDKDLLKTLDEQGPPPYDEIWPYQNVLTYESTLYPYDHTGNDETGGAAGGLFAEEYSLIDKVGFVAGLIETFSILYPQWQEIDFRKTAVDLPIPVYFIQGAHEATSRAVVFEQWYPMITAPHKELIIFERSGHRPLTEETAHFAQVMRDVVLAQNPPSGVSETN